jgi:hypothetical protein
MDRAEALTSETDAEVAIHLEIRMRWKWRRKVELVDGSAEKEFGAN